MSAIGFGRTAGGALITPAFPASQITAVTIYYNGQAITTTAGVGFDTQPFDDCMVMINVGTVQGAVATLINMVLESDTDNPAVAATISGATFTSRAVSSTAVNEKGAIRCKDTKRYLFLKTETQGSPLTINFSAAWVGGTPRSQPVEQALIFDV